MRYPFQNIARGAQTAVDMSHDIVLLHPRYQHSIFNIREVSMGGEALLRFWQYTTAMGDAWDQLDYYELLQVPRDASNDDIKKA